MKCEILYLCYLLLFTISPQAMSMFSSALASGQLGPLMNQFGLPAEAVDAANKGGHCSTKKKFHIKHLIMLCHCLIHYTVVGLHEIKCCVCKILIIKNIWFIFCITTNYYTSVQYTCCKMHKMHLKMTEKAGTSLVSPNKHSIWDDSQSSWTGCIFTFNILQWI